MVTVLLDWANNKENKFVNILYKCKVPDWCVIFRTYFYEKSCRVHGIFASLLEYLILYIKYVILWVKNKMYICLYFSYPYFFSVVFSVTIFFSNVKPSIVVRAELSQRRFIFRGRAYVGRCAQFIALGNLRTGENSQHRAPQVLLRCDSFSSSSYPAFVPGAAFVPPSSPPARRCTCTIEKTPLHAHRRRNVSCRVPWKREMTLVVERPGWELVSQPCNTYFSARIYRSI